VLREEPRLWRGKNIKGFIDEFSEPIGEAELKELFGGGTYCVQIQKRQGRGWEFFRQRTIKIAGDPKGYGIEASDPDGGANGQGSIEDVMRAAERMTQHLQGSSRESTQMFELMIQSLRSEIEASNRRNDQLMQEMRDMQQSRNQPSMSDHLLQKVVTEDSHRFDTIREAHSSEIRTLREIQRAEMEEIRRNSREDLQRQSDQHVRELDHLRDTHKDSKKALEQAYEQRIESLKSDRDRVMSDLTEARAKVAALEAKKDKSLIEQMGEISALKDAFKEFGGGDDEKPGKWYESAFDNLPTIIETVMDKVRPPGDAAAPAPAQAQLPAPEVDPADAQARASAASLGIDIPPGAPLPPIGHPFQLQENGPVYVRATATEFRQLTPEELKEMERESRAPSPEHVQMAITFLENAAANDRDPVEFARSVRAMIPGDTVDWIMEEGIDSLFQRAKIEQNSILRQQKGRNFARAAVEALQGD
jgi:hypothetical protein